VTGVPPSVTASVAGRAIALLVMAVLGWKLAARGLTLESSSGALSFIRLVDLVFHEAGHVIFGFFGSFIAALGGSLTQVLIPALCAAHLLRHTQLTSAAWAVFWMGENVIGVAIYVADGRDMKLPLLAEGLTHDWNYLLSELSLRDAAEPLGRLVFVAGVLTLLAAMTLVGWDLVRVWHAPAPEPALE
jgi:hypothetical protein